VHGIGHERLMISPVCLFLLMLCSSVLLRGASAFQRAGRGLSGTKVTYGGPKVGRVHKKGLRMSASDMGPVRVRFAPSPTGTLHVGGARTALFNWLLAKKTGGQFIIRVEDTDEARSTRESEDAILADVAWMNMNWDEGPHVEGPHGPYRQSQRKEIYQKHARDLMARGIAYPCFCTAEELEAQRAAAEEAGVDPTYDGTWRDADPALVKAKMDAGVPYTVRFKVPESKIVSIDDIVRGKVTWDAQACLGDFIMLRSTGVPVYNFCVAVDDKDMQITHVVRAEEHLSNTLRQMLIFEAIGHTPPVYAHCSLILGSDRSKLSKRHGATSVSQFAKQGFLPEAMMNYLANLGWNDGTDKEIYTPGELVQAFSLERVVKSAAVFDMDKLTWVNSQHIKALPRARMVSEVRAVLGGMVSEEKRAEGTAFVEALSAITQDNVDLLVDVLPVAQRIVSYPIERTITDDAEAAELVQQDSFAAICATLTSDAASGALPTGTEEDFPGEWKKYMKALGKALGLKGKGLFHPVRLALTGEMSGPDVGAQLQLVGIAERGAVVGPVVPMLARFEHISNMSSVNAQIDVS